jgi:tetratricopeptide (TPR) repeat protein
MNKIIRSQTSIFENAHLVDSYTNFENASPHGILGNELLLEHVHPNLDGYALLGYSFYNALQEHGEIAKNWPKSLSKTDFQRQMPITEVDSLAGLYEIMMLKEGWPFYEPIDKDQLKTNTTPQIISGQLAIKKFTWENAMQQLYGHHLQNGQDAKALRVLQALILNQPQQKNLYLEAGKLAVTIDSIAVADRIFGKLYRLNDSIKNTQIIARSFIDAGALLEALSYVEKIKEANPSNVQAMRYLTAIKGILNMEAKTGTEQDTTILLDLAEYYRQLDQPENSFPLVEKVLANEPKNIRGVAIKERTGTLITMETFKEFFLFLRSRKKYWLIPLIVMLILISAIVVLTASSALAPFIYSLF